MSDLDKFKRRLIRSLARLLLQEKKPEEEVWEVLKKETGCDCKLLWKRMRSLTIKKLKRLLAADDLCDNIATYARLSLTDWLLFDLVLAHEPIDVIGQDSILPANKTEHKALVDLFSLVQRFGTEGVCSGDELAQRWSAACITYNSDTRNVSPMLLQRRWFQLKEETRASFYKLWHSYRGNLRLWSSAHKYKPSRLQMAIAKRYPQVIIRPFPKWEELIEKRLVILAEEFEEKMRMTDLPKPCSADDPDLVLLEPVIETIDLGVDSDPEGTSQNDDPDGIQNDDSNTRTSLDIDLSVVKKEPEEDCLSNVRILEATHIPTESMDKDVYEPSTEQDPRVLGKQKRLMIVNEFIKATQEFADDDEPIVTGISGTQTVNPESAIVGTDDIVETDDIVSTDDIINEKVDQYLRDRLVSQTMLVQSEDIETDDIMKQKADQLCRENRNQTAAKSDSEEDLDSDNLIKEKADAFLRQKNAVSEGPTLLDTDYLIKEKANDFFRTKIKTIMSSSAVNAVTTLKPATDQTAETHIIEDDLVDDIIKQKAEEFVHKADKNLIMLEDKIELPIDMDILVNEGMELVDDGIEYIDEEEETTDSVNKGPETSTAMHVMNEATEKSLQLLQYKETASKFDLKLLMTPMVYTTKLEHMTVLKDKDFHSVEGVDAIDTILAQSKPKRVITKIDVSLDDQDSQDSQNIQDDLFNNDANGNVSDSDVNDLYISDDKRVRITSSLLQKPKSRSYNPIQLCKNPDFNTRLKRLNVGFFISERNKRQYKACKPMTVDLHKAFETKLIEGTLYLKSSDVTSPAQAAENEQNETTVVVPSAMPLQSLIDSIEASIEEEIPSNVRAKETMPTEFDICMHDSIIERSKVIKLPNITQIRRINQKLLVAEVPPIRQNVSNVTRLSPPLPPTQTEQSQNAPNSTNANKSTHSKSSLKGIYQEIAKQRAEIETLIEATNATNDDVINPEPMPENSSNSRSLVTLEPRQPVRKVGRPGNPNKINNQQSKKYINYHLNSRVPITWNSRVNVAPPPIDDFLLTVDTLNKMINQMDGTETYVDPSKKNKKPNWVINRNDAQAPPKPKPKPVSKPKPRLPNEGNCCWCSYRLKKAEAGDRAYKQHSCPKAACYCCCRQRLEIYKCQNPRQRVRKLPVNVTSSIILSDDDADSLQKACASIESVVQQSNVPIPTVRIIDKNTNTAFAQSTNVNTSLTDNIFEKIAAVVPTTPYQQNNISCSHSASSSASKCSGRGLPMSIGHVTANKKIIEQAVATETTPAPNYITPPETMPKSPNLSNEVHALSISINFTPGNDNVSPVPNIELHPPKLIPITANSSPSTKMYHTRRHPSAAHIQAATKISSHTQTMDVPLLENMEMSSLEAKTNYVNATRIPIQDDDLRQIVLDGSKRCPIPRTVVKRNPQKREKVVSMIMTKKPSENPICIGKNKLLLTTVKFPPHLKSSESTPTPEISHPKVITPLPLPAGVQLILLPNGDLTYTMEPGMELNSEQLQIMPAILIAVQQQINLASPQQSDTPAALLNAVPISISDDESAPTVEAVTTPQKNKDQEINANNPEPNTNLANTVNLKEIDESALADTIHSINKQSDVAELDLTRNDKELMANNESNDTENVEPNNLINNLEHSDNNAITTNVSTSADDISTENVKDQSDDCSLVLNDATSTLLDVERPKSTIETRLVESTQSNADLETVEPIDSQNDVQNAVQTDENSNAGGGRNLLSDLMQMSGISAEDTKLVPQEMPPPQATDNSVVLQTTLGGPTDVLSPVTSLAQLKYACEHNGNFFKLDMDTGTVSPINVSIKKSTRSKSNPNDANTVSFFKLDANPAVVSPNKVYVRNSSIFKRDPNTVSTIDLTDDSTIEDKTHVPCDSSPTESEQATPVKLFRTSHGVKSKKAVSILSRRPYKKIDISEKIVDRKRTKRKRKQELNKIEAKIDLVDSDAPMEEEYLLDSSDSEQYSVTMAKYSSNSSQSNIIADSSDSSDDEPLAKKAKRVKNDKVYELKDKGVTDVHPQSQEAPNTTATEVIAADSANTAVADIHDQAQPKATEPNNSEEILETGMTKDLTEGNEEPNNSEEILEAEMTEDRTEGNDVQPDNSLESMEVGGFINDDGDSGDICILGV